MTALMLSWVFVFAGFILVHLLVIEHGVRSVVRFQQGTISIHIMLVYALPLWLSCNDLWVYTVFDQLNVVDWETMIER